MSTLTIPRPKSDESAPFYHDYIAEVPGENLGTQLVEQLQEVERLFDQVTDTAALARYAPGKWSIKEVLGHLSDTERIFSYRLLRIARNDSTPLAGFDENAYVPAGGFDQRPLPMLLAEFRAVRLSPVALMEGLSAECWSRRGQANGKPISARALAYIIVGHVKHHFTVLRARYGLGLGSEAVTA
jgi:DinB superfamily